MRDVGGGAPPLSDVFRAGLTALDRIEPLPPATAVVHQGDSHQPTDTRTRAMRASVYRNDSGRGLGK